jgi:guanylate kinase
MKQGKLAVISGFSGVGKGTVVKKLVAEKGYQLSISATTRAPREGEQHGREYYFITKEDFEKRIAEQDFLEYARYVDNYYGTPRSFTMERLEAGQDVILEIEAQGAFKVKEQYPEAMLIFMLPPSMTELKSRLIGRGTESDEVIAKRLHRAMEELELARHYDYLIVNDTVESCAERLDQLIQTGDGQTSNPAALLDQLRDEGKRIL